MGGDDIVQTLRNYLISHPDFKDQFEASFNAAVATGIPQFREYKIKTFSDYINSYETFLSWIPQENSTSDEVLFRFSMLYFVMDLPPVNNFQTKISPWTGRTWLSQWIIDYAKELGTFMDTTASLTPETLKTFYKAPKYHMEDYDPFPGPWKTFNEFFARKIKKAARPIDPGPLVIVSPADSTFAGSWPIDSEADVTTFPNNPSFTAKGIPWSISELLEDTEYGERFKGGQFTHAFLAPFDYHRQHSPVSGKVIEAKVIPGLCYLQVIVKEDEMSGVPMLKMDRKLRAPVRSPSATAFLHDPDSPGYQFLQARGLILIENPDIGLVAVLPIGMAQVSSVVLTVKAGQTVEKGEEISYFQFGGSDVVVVFESKQGVKIDITATKNHEEFPCPGHYNFGQQIAVATITPS